MSNPNNNLLKEQINDLEKKLKEALKEKLNELNEIKVDLQKVKESKEKFAVSVVKWGAVASAISSIATFFISIIHAVIHLWRN